MNNIMSLAYSFVTMFFDRGQHSYNSTYLVFICRVVVMELLINKLINKKS